MKKTTRNILIMLAVLIVLGGGAYFLLKTPVDNGEDVSSAVEEPTAESIVLTDRDVSEVVSIDVENRYGEYTIVPVNDNSGDFTLKGYENDPVNKLTATSAVKAVVHLESSRDLGAREDLENYGLKGENSTSLNITYSNGEKDSVVIGSPAGESSGRYLLFKDSVHIGVISSNAMLNDKFSYFSSSLYSVPNRTETVTDENGNETTQDADDVLYHISFSGTHFPEDIEITYTPTRLSTYLLQSPIVADSGTKTLTAIIEALKSPSAASVCAVHITDGDLEEFGLKEPYAKVKFDMNNEQHELSVSAVNSDGIRFLMMDDVDMIYRVSDETVSSWAEADLMKLRMSYIWLENITDMKEINITVKDGTKYTFTTTREVDEQTSTDTKTLYKITSVKNSDGKELNYDNFKAYFRSMLSIAVLNADKPEYSSKPEYSIVYKNYDGTIDTVDFCASGEDRFAVELNGAFTGQVRRSETDKVFGTLGEVSSDFATE